jgi:signal transduction histidine kinase
MSQRLQLADVNGDILVDTGTDSPFGALTRLERNRSVELKVDGEVVGYLYPEGSMAFSQVAESNLISRLNRAAITAALMASGVALVVALFLSYRLLRPVRELTRAARQLAAGDLSQRVAVRGDDELATLANTFNQMAVSLQQAEERRRAMTADIAHELRTPLTVQRAHLEALDDGIYKLSLESLKPIEAQNHLLTRLVDDLRTLALADSGQLELVRTSTDFPALIRRVITGLEPKVADRQVELQLTLDESCPSLSLDAQRVEQILHNLLDNALRYTPDGGTISVQCTAVSEQCLLTVRDSGPGIPEDALPLLFERFYRADKSRSRYEGGTGLGLSIARKIAQAHGGDLTATNHPDGGAVFTLKLPLS